MGERRREKGEEGEERGGRAGRGDTGRLAGECESKEREGKRDINEMKGEKKGSER